jgi:hypothetical protein
LRIRDLSIRLPGIAAAARRPLRAELAVGPYQMPEARRWRNLAAPGTTATRILPANPRRRGLQLFNAGTGQVNVAGSPVMDPGYPIPGGDTFAPANMPIAPQNDIYATGDAGHDLWVLEIFEP